MISKVVSAEAAVELIKDGDTVSTTGFGLSAFAEEVVIALEHKFLTQNRPQGLTLLHAAGQGNWKGDGIDRLGREGLIRRTYCGHFDTMPKINALINANKIEGYNLPQGAICHLYRAIAAHKPGEITKVGLQTYVDPRLGGGKMNQLTKTDYVQVLNLGGEEWLFYPSMPINVGIIRGTTADEAGNVTLEDEIVPTEGLSLAQAVHACGGKVIVQVKYLAHTGTLNPQLVKIPGTLVDAVVVCKEPEKYHRQTAGTFFNPALTGRVKIPIGSFPRIALDEKKVMARRAILELTPDAVVNLGVGTPEFIAAIAAEEHVLEKMTLTTEAGSAGGMPAPGLDFGAAINSWALIDTISQFDFYDGGGLDIAFLGMAETDENGNVNVSRFGAKIPGCGGFINITQNTKTVVFCGKFTSGKGKAAIGDGTLRPPADEGGGKKFVRKVQQVTFSGAYAAETGQRVLYVTERAVFELRGGRLMLIELAPGVDLKRDVLAHMEFLPDIAEPLKRMDAAIFREERMELLHRWNSAKA